MENASTIAIAVMAFVIRADVKNAMGTPKKDVPQRGLSAVPPMAVHAAKGVVKTRNVENWSAVQAELKSASPWPSATHF